MKRWRRRKPDYQHIALMEWDLGYTDRPPAGTPVGNLYREIEALTYSELRYDNPEVVKKRFNDALVEIRAER